MKVKSNQQLNSYDVVYKTKSGRAMVAKKVEAKTANAAKAKVKSEMRASTSFDKVVMAIKL